MTADWYAAWANPTIAKVAVDKGVTTDDLDWHLSMLHGWRPGVLTDDEYQRAATIAADCILGHGGSKDTCAHWLKSARRMAVKAGRGAGLLGEGGR